MILTKIEKATDQNFTFIKSIGYDRAGKITIMKYRDKACRTDPSTPSFLTRDRLKQINFSNFDASMILLSSLEID
jgi:hypothetical protein